MNRWDNYFLRRGKEFQKFWNEYLNKTEHNVLFIIGQGFDPRMCLGTEKILDCNGKGKRDCILINYSEGKDSPSSQYSDEETKNLDKLKELFDKKGQITVKSVELETKNGKRVGPRKAAELFSNIDDFIKYTDVVMDISSLPLNIYFSLLGKILTLLDEEVTADTQKVPNLHVIVTENTVMDSSIKKTELFVEAKYLHGLTGGLETHATDDIPKVWIPILGEAQKVQLERIGEYVAPEEICPVIPSPSFNLRRGDNMILEYRDLLFKRLRIESKNILYASETNPFEEYRQISRTISHYKDALSPLGGCKVAISALSSKLMSIGAFLVTYEGVQKDQSIGIAYLESKGYEMKKVATLDSTLEKSELFSMWIFGDCYRH